LIEQLQEEALDPKVALSDLLRKAKLCAVKLGLSDAATWVDHELNGYPAGVKLPVYRQLQGSAQYRTLFHGWLPLRFSDAQMNEMLSRALMGHSIAEIEQLLEYDDPIATYLPEQIELLRQAIPNEFTDAGVQLGKSALVGLLDAVRNRVSEWAVHLEMAGVRGEGRLSFSNSDREAAAHVTYNITVGGSVTGNVGSVSGHAVVNATHIGPETVQALSQLADSIRQSAGQMGLSAEAQGQLERDAVTLKEEVSRPTPDKTRLGKVLGSIKSIAENAAGSLAASGVLYVLARPEVAALIQRVMP